jgi:tRNA(Ile2) C34 agmatinyltransferase TiaS
MSGRYLYCPDCGEYLGSLGSDDCHLCGWRLQQEDEDEHIRL